MSTPFNPDPSGPIERDEGNMTFGGGEGTGGGGTGPQGPQGPTGATGATGATGPAGPAGDLSGQSIYNFIATINLQTGTTYTTQNGDSGKIVELNNGSSITVTLHKAATVGTTISFTQMGAGQVTFSPEAGGAILRNRSTHTKIAGQYGCASAYVRANSGGSAAEWVLTGDTST